MVWFRVDDNLAFHPKAMQAGNAAMGLWVRAGSWCTQQLNDGVVPREIVAALGGNEFVADDLVAAGLWHEHPKGYEFHDWKGYQFTRSEVEANRAAARDRMQRRRSGEQPANGSVRANFARSSASPTLPYPVVPDGTTEGALASAKPARSKRGSRVPEDFAVTDDMRAWAAANTPSIDVDAETAKFVDHWKAQPGQKGVKLDWLSTWRNWMRRAVEYGSRGGGYRTQEDRNADVFGKYA
jgi:hypothetical protein